MSIEVWITCPSLPEYEASSFGRVRSKPFIGTLHTGAPRWYGGKPTLGYWAERERRYKIVYRGHSYKVHRLICEAFHGPAPADKPNCLHADENSRNNRPDNLSWGTQKENLNAPGFLSAASKAWKGTQKRTLDPSDIDHIKARYARGETLRVIAGDYGVAPCTLSNRMAGRGCARQAA